MTERSTFAERAKRRYLQAAGHGGNSRGPAGRAHYPGDTSTGVNTTGREEQFSLRNENLTRVKNAPGPLPAVSSSLATALLMGGGLLMLELANAATSYFALESLMGPAGVWRASFALLLTLGLATLDAGGLYRLFHPATAGESNRTFGLWCLLLGWLLAATTNSILRWWAFSLALLEHAPGDAILSQAQILEIAPVFLSLAIWLLRIFVIAGWAQGGGEAYGT